LPIVPASVTSPHPLKERAGPLKANEIIDRGQVILNRKAPNKIFRSEDRELDRFADLQGYPEQLLEKKADVPSNSLPGAEFKNFAAGSSAKPISI
jgi:hypothetical protein